MAQTERWLLLKEKLIKSTQGHLIQKIGNCLHQWLKQSTVSVLVLPD